MKEAQKKRPDANQVLAAERGEYVEGISDPTDPKWITEDLTKPKQPEVSNMGNGVFSIDGLMDSQPAPALSIVDQARQRAAEEKLHPANSGETTSDVQMETAQPVEDENDNAVSAGEGADEPPAQTIAVNMSKILAERCPDLTAEVLKSQVSESAHSDEEEEAEQAAPAWPEYFEPGRYEGVPNEVYHASNGISSTMVKDARVSLMYFEARHVSKTIQKVRSPVLDMGNLVHALALQPDQLEKEFSIEPEIPEGAFTTTATIRAFIDEYNNGLPVLLSADDIKRFLEEYNANLPAQVPLGTSVEETGQGYMSLPAEFQRIEDGQKQTATAMKACIKEYNATLPAQVKTSGGRDALLEQLALINPDMVTQEAQKAQPLKVSGTKADLIQAVKSVKPDAVFADELLDAWRENPEGKVLVTRQQLATALAIQKALLNHPTAGKLLTHPSRAVEVSYFGIDEETGLEVRVRPDLEIDMGGLRIGADLKTISMWNIKQEGLRAKLHREIIERDYHLSAAMYCETAALDQFFWIFVNKDENYHWIAIIEASEEMLELGMLEYRKAMRAIANGFDTGEWPAPISNPKQQIAYLGVKYWARLYCPEVILGVYSPDEVEQRTEREINPAPAQRMSVAEITSGTDITTSAQDSALNIDSLADDFRDRIERAESVDAAKAIRADLDKEKAVLGTVLFTELKGKAVQRYFMVDARNKVEAAINSLPNPGDPEAEALFAKAESTLTSSRRHLGDELYEQFRITLDDMKPEYVG